MSIETAPSHGPYKENQSLYLSCLIQPAPSDEDSVTYQWDSVAGVYGGLNGHGTTQNISLWSNPHTNELRFSWFFCKVFINGTLAGSAYKLVERSGKQSTGG